MGTLGCATTYGAVIHYQGGKHVHSRLDGLTNVTWSRRLDDHSEATATLAKRDLSARCRAALAGEYRPDGTIIRPGIEPWMHELSLYRDGGLVWQGPIVETTENRDTVEIQARDMLFWMDRRVIAVTFQGGTPDENKYRGETGEMLRQIFTATWPGTHDDNPYDNPGLTEYARIDDTPGTYTETERIWKGSRTVGDLVRDTITSGIDMFTLGRKVYLVPDFYRINHTPYRFTEQHFTDDLEVRKLGLDMATEGFVTGRPENPPADTTGNPPPYFGKWPPQETGGGPDNPCTPAWYGRITKFHESTSLTGSGPYTEQQPALQEVARSIRDYGFPCPKAIVVPNGASLTPEAPMSIGQMVPGRVISVELADYITPTQELFRLNELEVSWTASNSSGPEQVQVSLVSMRNPPVGSENQPQGSSGAASSPSP